MAECRAVHFPRWRLRVSEFNQRWNCHLKNCSNSLKLRQTAPWGAENVSLPSDYSHQTHCIIQHKNPQETRQGPATHTHKTFTKNAHLGTIMTGKGRGHRGHGATPVAMVTGRKNVGSPVFIVLVKFSHDFSDGGQTEKVTEGWTATDEGTETRRSGWEQRQATWWWWWWW